MTTPETGAWTQSIQPSKNVLAELEHRDIILYDEQFEPFAVLVKVERYVPNVPNR